MYNQKLAGAILEKLNEMFPTPTSSDDLWEFQVKGFADVAKSEWLVVIDALLGMGQVRGVPLRDGSHLQNAADLKLTGQGREELRRTQATTSFGASSVVRDDLVFLTHATKDQTLAIFLKNLIENSVPGADVFVSSDTEDLRPGDEWVRRIRENLRAGSSVGVVRGGVRLEPRDPYDSVLHRENPQKHSLGSLFFLSGLEP
jgi:hypothetical protein